jgi:hypothetical protein
MPFLLNRHVCAYGILQHAHAHALIQYIQSPKIQFQTALPFILDVLVIVPFYSEERLLKYRHVQCVLCASCVLIRTQCYVIMAFIDAFDFFCIHQKKRELFPKRTWSRPCMTGKKVESRRPFLYFVIWRKRVGPG